MTLQEEKQVTMSEQRQSNALQTPGVPDAGDHLDHLLLSEVEIPWYKSFAQNVREIINPPKLPAGHHIEAGRS